MVVLNSCEMESNVKTVLIAQEISFAKTLACNDKRLRDRALRKLRKWLINRAQPDKFTVFTKQDMMTLWKGLFFCMWMSDKPIIQEELAVNISNLLSCFNNNANAAFMFIDAFFSTMRGHWSSIDNYRIGKFQMLVRRMLRQTLHLSSNNDWELASQCGDMLWSSVLSGEGGKAPALGLSLHVCEIFLEELAKQCGRVGLSQTALTALLRPFCRYLASKSRDVHLRGTITNAIFSGLIKQSDEGLEHQEKLDAWRRMGCPAIPLEQLERVELPKEADDEDVTEDEDPCNELDPRAGQLDVELPQIPFDPLQVASLINEFIAVPDTNGKVKRHLKSVAKKFEELAQGHYPLEFKLPLVDDDDELLEWNDSDAVEEAAYSLSTFETQLNQEEANMGIAKRAALKRLAMQELVASIPKKQKRARRRSSGNMNWKVTEISESEQSVESGNAVSPGTKGFWEVSPDITSDNHQLAMEWEKPLQDGEYEYFVTPRKRKPALLKNKTKKNMSPKATKLTPSNNSDNEIAVLSNGNISFSDVSKTNDVNPCIMYTPTSIGNRNLDVTTPTSTAFTMEGTDRLSISMGSGKKKVEFKLARNMFQEVREYTEQLKNSPGIPHNPNKRPTQGLLKSSTPTTGNSPFIRQRTRVFL